MTPNFYAPFRLWCPIFGGTDDSAQDPAVLNSERGVYLLDPKIVVESVTPSIAISMVEHLLAWTAGRYAVLPLRDPARCTALIDAFRADPRVILALHVERPPDLERLVPGIDGLYVVPGEEISRGVWHCRLPSCGCQGIGPLQGAIQSMERCSLVIAHGPIGDRPCSECSGRGGWFQGPLPVWQACLECRGQGSVSPAVCRSEWISAIARDCASAGVPCCVPDAGVGEWRHMGTDMRALESLGPGRWSIRVVAGQQWAHVGWQNQPAHTWPREMPEGWTNG